MPSKELILDWGYGDPDDPAYRSNHIDSFTAGGITLTCRKELIPIFEHLVTEISEWGIDLAHGVADDWGYENRDIHDKPGVKSWHSVGAAVDLDATRNLAMSKTTTFPVRKTLSLCSDLGLTWGRTWDDRPDPMHFEVAHPLQVMVVSATRFRPQEGDRPAFRRPLSQGDRGPNVLWVQQRLSDLGYLEIKPNGQFGYLTTRAMRRFESDRGFKINGVVSAVEYDALVK